MAHPAERFVARARRDAAGRRSGDAAGRRDGDAAGRRDGDAAARRAGAPGWPGESLRLRTSDGETLSAVHLRPPPDAPEGVGAVVAHGFTGSLRRPAFRAAAERFARHFGVLAFDFRGHGGSTGRSTLGDREVLDVDAAVHRMRGLGYARVVTIGFSMGASAVLRHAALVRGVDAVVTISGVSRWWYRETVPMRRLHWVVERRMGRLLVRHALHTRVSARGWDPVPESPIEVVARVAPTPLLIVHGDHDPFFGAEHARALAAAAGDPVELWVVPGLGHAETAVTPALLDRIAQALPGLLARGPGA